MSDWKRKLTRRQFWAAVADFVGMLLVALHGADTTATQVTALIMAGAGVIAYIIGEGLADKAGVVDEEIERVFYDADDENPGGAE